MKYTDVTSISPPNPPTVYVGQQWKDKTNGCLYMVAKVQEKYALVNLRSGFSYNGLWEVATGIFGSPTERQDFVPIEVTEVLYRERNK